jgi:hypothetical protein
LKKRVAKEERTKEDMGSRVEIGNSKGLLKTERVKGHNKIEAAKVKVSNVRSKTGMGKDLSDRINPVAIVKVDNQTASKILPTIETIHPIGPHKERVVPEKIINK